MEIKYYKYISRRTGKLTKSYGFTVTVPWLQSLHIILEDGLAVVKKSALSTRTHSWTPAGDELQELSKEDFEDLSLPDETISDKFNREKIEILIKRLEVKEKTEFPDNFIDVLRKRFEDFHK